MDMRHNNDSLNHFRISPLSGIGFDGDLAHHARTQTASAITFAAARTNAGAASFRGIRRCHVGP